MNEIFDRSALLLGSAAVENLQNKKVAVFGIGGVGGYAVEALARTGIGHLTLIDKDCVSVSNINRQIIATSENVGTPKVEAAIKRVRAINPEIDVQGIEKFYNEDTYTTINLSGFDYILDAIDTVKSKVLLITEAKKAKVPIISCMGAGNKFDPTAFRVSDIYKTSVCPLAKIMRHELKKHGVTDLKVVYSTEQPGELTEQRDAENGKRVVGSIASVVSIPGMIMANEVILDLSKR